MATNSERTDIGMGIGMGDCKPAQHFGEKKRRRQGATNLERANIGMSMNVGDTNPAP